MRVHPSGFGTSVCRLLVATAVLASCAGVRQAQPDPKPLQVVISEIHYADPSGNPTDGFVEILNTGDDAAPIGKWCLDGTGFCFEEGTVLEPGAALAVESASMRRSLATNGETIALKDRRGKVLDSVSYGTRAPWPRTADGIGYSLNRVLPPVAATTADQWFGWWPTPNAVTEPTVRTAPDGRASVVINEIHYHHPDDDPSREFIELLNVGSGPQAIGGWCAVRSPSLRNCVEGAVTLAPGAFHLIGGFTTADDLPDGGGRIELLDASGARADLVYYDDHGEWPALADGHGESLQRRDASLSGLEPGNWESAAPTPGAANSVAAGSLMPMFNEVSHTVSPSPTQPIRVTARLKDAVDARLAYVIGLGKETTVAMATTPSGAVTASIPAQPAGTLVRYRLVAGDGVSAGTWPRQGDGATYDGTVVESTAETKLPRLQWFIADDLYDKVYADRDLNGDQGYATVFAYDGQIFDNATIRIKGNQSRSNVKKKWKIVLPAGHEWDAPEFFPYKVNEFALHSMETDRSMLREVLTSDLQQLSGGFSQRVTPIRLEKNGQFYGLYQLVELPDGRWRRVHGFSNDTVVVKAERTATLKTSHLNLPAADFDVRYKRMTQTYVEGNKEVRSLIEMLNLGDRNKVLDFVYRHVDVPQVVEAIATMRIVQHFEWAHKNYTLFYDPADEKWRLHPVDHDLNMGNRWHHPCGAFCYETMVYNFDHFGSNRMGYVFLDSPELRAMVDRRTKTLADAFFAEGRLEKRIAELAELYGKDAGRDAAKWHSGRTASGVTEAQRTLLKDYIEPKRRALVEDRAHDYPPSQRAEISFSTTTGGDGSVTVTNTDDTTIDLSGQSITGLPSPVPAGVVLNPGQTVVFSTNRTPAPATAGTPRTLHVWVPLATTN